MTIHPRMETFTSGRRALWFYEWRSTKGRALGQLYTWEDFLDRLAFSADTSVERLLSNYLPANPESLFMPEHADWVFSVAFNHNLHFNIKYNRILYTYDICKTLRNKLLATMLSTI